VFFPMDFYPQEAHVEIISSGTEARFELAIDVPWGANWMGH